MNDLWFISYRMTTRNMIDDECSTVYRSVITDVTPAKWVLESQYVLGGSRVILYAEKISRGLAVELSHGGGGVPTAYFNENL